LRAIPRTEKPLIFIVLHGGAKRFCPALGRLEQPLRNYAAQRHALDLGPALPNSIAGGSNSESVP
jgi:hypothetical protein